MSGPAPAPAASEDPALDPGVLTAEPVCEFGGWLAVERHQGTAVLHWRADFLAAQAAGVACSASPLASRFPQVLVRIQRGRAGTQEDIADALKALAPEGLLVVSGPNVLGIAGWIRRLEAVCGPALRTVARAKARVAVFRPPPAPVWDRPPAGQVPAGGSGTEPLLALPGVFSGDDLDPGSALLVGYLEAQVCAGRVVDLGCGAGHLGIAALRSQAQATCDFYDADIRAVRSTQANCQRLALASRARATWWDAHEPLPHPGADLVLINPPAHQGAEISLGPALAMLRAAQQILAPTGRLLLVANQRLPYERELARIGPCRLALQQNGYKILETTREDGGANGRST